MENQFEINFTKGPLNQSYHTLTKKEKEDLFIQTKEAIELFAEIVDSNIKKENERLKGFIKTHDAKCCEFMRAGGMFWCNEITTCEYYNKFVKPKLK